MYGGQITGNTTTEYGTGGGVRVEGAEDAASSTTFNLYGGSINGNQSGYGGGVYVSRVVWEGASRSICTEEASQAIPPQLRMRLRAMASAAESV